MKKTQNLFAKASILYRLLYLLCIVSIRAQGANINTRTPDIAGDPFILTPYVTRQVTFWEKIFYIFPSSALVIHDSEDPDIIIEVVDNGNNYIDDPTIIRNIKMLRDRKINELINNYQLAIKKIKSTYPNFFPTNDTEEKIASIYLSNRKNRDRFLKKTIKLRVQSGLSDRFAEAAHTAQYYLPNMESIFSKHDLPPSLTRMAFVESMFNTNARSKVGASGIWQFMPTTAKLFLFVNDFIDERNSPLKATKAAAQLLYKNHLILKSWPHAITAYNHGIYGMQQAIASVNSVDFDAIILNYQNPSFGFASRNFYAEFIAAKRIHEMHYSKLIHSPSEKHVTSSIILTRSVTLQELSNFSGLSIEEIFKFNPCLLKKDLKIWENKTLPIYFELFAPQHNINILNKKIREKEDIYSAL